MNFMLVRSTPRAIGVFALGLLAVVATFGQSINNPTGKIVMVEDVFKNV